MAAYERLSVADRALLGIEGRCSHMHMGGVTLFEAGPLATAHGGIDIGRIRRHIASRLHLAPRYRQRLEWIPLQSHPVWVDDVDFNLAYHVRHVAVPRPGDERQLKRLSGHILSESLDRGKPLWEIWIVEGIEGGRFALLLKVHHCMVDGLAAFELFSALLTPSPDEPMVEAPPWVPRAAPGRLTLLRDELVRRATLPLDAAGTVVEALQEPGHALSRVAESVVALRETIAAGLHVRPETPLNGPLGPHRRVDWCALDLAAVKRVKDRLGGTVNEVVLAVVAGAVRRFLLQRGANVAATDFRVVIPVSLRAADDHAMTNRASAWLVTLPIAEPDPARRHAAVRTVTRRRRLTKQELGPVIVGQFAEWAPPLILAVGLRLAARLPPFNLIVSNMPGPQFPLYMLGARMLVGYPHMPLFEHQALGIALFSYAGQLGWGFDADWDLVPDLHDFVEHVEASFRELELIEPAASAAAG
jgi:diacylglycerol O-acyltransferase